MCTIAVVGNRGSGKTTLAVNIASALAKNAPTVLFDADPRGFAQHWRPRNVIASRLPVVDASWNLEQIINDKKGRFDHALIDCSPSMHEQQTQHALAISDIALVLVQPTSLQLWASTRINQAIVDMRKCNPSLRALMVINQLPLRKKLSRQFQKGIAEIEMPAATTVIRERLAYQASIDNGCCVQEMGLMGRSASSEINQLIKEVLTP